MMSLYSSAHTPSTRAGLARRKSDLSPLRSKTKRKNRAVKREDPKSAFKIAEDVRMARLNAALKESALKPRALTDKEEWERQQEGYETEEEEPKVEGEGAKEGEMQVEGGAEAGPSGEGEGKKVSTSGPRMSRREAYRSSKGFTVKQTPRTMFTAKGEKKRQGCKPHRRR
ncbi:hypothetical protein JCM6882_006123 [Rhodosporidiobolus microsporus]